MSGRAESRYSNNRTSPFFFLFRSFFCFFAFPNTNRGRYFLWSGSHSYALPVVCTKMASCTLMLWIWCFPWMLWPLHALLFLLSALVLRVFCWSPQDYILRPSLLEKHAADFMNNIKVNNLSQSLSNSPACSFLHMDSSSQICLFWWCSCTCHSFAAFFSTISYCLSILLGWWVHCSVMNIFILIVSFVCHLLSDDHLLSVLKWGL